MKNIILAAGAALRSGGEKLFWQYKGKSVIRRSVEASLSADLETIVVVGYRAEDVERELHPLFSDTLRIVKNPDWEKGQFTSVQAGAREITFPDMFFITPGDMPLLTADDYSFVADHMKRDYDAVRPFVNGKPGHPVLLRGYLLPFITGAEGEESMKRLLTRFTVGEIPSANADYVTDIDTREAFEALR